VHHRFEAERRLLARKIDHEVPSDREQPCVETAGGVVLLAALEDADPGLLKEIVGAFATTGEVRKVAIKPVLIDLDEPLQ